MRRGEGAVRSGRIPVIADRYMDCFHETFEGEASSYVDNAIDAEVKEGV